MESQEEILDNNRDNLVQRDEQGHLLPGSKLNPNGRPKGSLSIKDAVRKHLEENPEDVKEIVKHFVKDNRELMWQMLEGKPQQDITSGGEKLIPTPIYGGQSANPIQISGHDSNTQDILPEEKN